MEVPDPDTHLKLAQPNTAQKHHATLVSFPNCKFCLNRCHLSPLVKQVGERVQVGFLILALQTF